ncbi:MAG: trimeric intracellular cation channel family protein [Mycobacteriaceae bacterium]
MTGDGVGDVFRALDLVGVFGNALLGGLIARHEKLDPIGFATLAVLSGLGGGLIRDVLLQHGTPIALTDSAYLVTAFAGAAVSYLANVEGRIWHRAWPLVDAVALGCWASTGAQKTLGVGLGWLPAVLLGVITAVGGGAVRDVVLRRVPGVLGGNTLYATAALAGAGTLTLVTRLGQPTAGSIAGLVMGAGLCLVARWRGWILPSADAWSATSVVPHRYLGRLKQRRGRSGSTRSAEDRRSRPEESKEDKP